MEHGLMVYNIFTIQDQGLESQGLRKCFTCSIAEHFKQRFWIEKEYIKSIFSNIFLNLFHNSDVYITVKSNNNNIIWSCCFFVLVFRSSTLSCILVLCRVNTISSRICIFMAQKLSNFQSPKKCFATQHSSILYFFPNEDQISNKMAGYKDSSSIFLLLL